ncbi:MAG: HAMP domain-containing histidine kinase [Firmicutes bacterium]|nr:HAMP domain-containing histidine kinase [Bacillota bacterium]
MKNRPIKTRLTIYYTAVLAVIVLASCALIYFNSSQFSQARARENLLQVVQAGFSEIPSDPAGDPQIPTGFSVYRSGVSLILYDASGVRLKGAPPADLPKNLPLESGTFKQIAGTDGEYLLYDLRNPYENGQALYIRGIYTIDRNYSQTTRTARILMTGLPILALLAILGGILIARRALDPVTGITRAAEQITGGGDLSRRLPLPENKDELYDLSETLNEMIGRLEGAFLAEKNFSADVSHELRTPVSVILAECEHELEQDRTPSEYREALSTIQSQCRRIMSMIEQLLKLSRQLDAASMIEEEELDLSLLCESICCEMEGVAAGKGVRLTWDIAPDVLVRGDETLLMRLLINLINNAVKYRDPNKNEPSVSFALSCEDGKARIEVADNGIGIAESDLDHIFERFYKADKSRDHSVAAPDESFGLGLSMVRWIAEAHGGSVSVESQVGEGSRFTVLLPRV